jgi:hypothetical protein
MWLLTILLFLGLAWSLNLTAYNWWLSSGPPVRHPEVYKHRGDVFCVISFGFLLAFVLAVRNLIRARVRPSAIS